MRHWTIVLLFLGASFSGCLAGLVDDEPTELTAADEGPGEADEHGEPTIEWGPVQTELTASVPLGWRAWQTATVTNDFGGASYSVVTLQSDAGGVDVRPLDDAPEGSADGEVGYLILATREGYGASEEQAIEAMEEVTLTHTDELRGDTLHLTTVIEVPDDDTSGPTGLLNLVTTGRGGGIDAYLPTGPRHEVQASTGSGGIDIVGLRLYSATAETGSGGIDVEDVEARLLTLSTGSGGIDVLDSFVNTLVADTGSGGIDLEGSFADIDASTGSGGIDARVRPYASGSFVFETGSGGVDVELVGSSRNGYDVEASTGSGGIDIDIPDGERLDERDDGDRYQHVRTRGYDDKDTRTRIDASTGSGGVDIQG